MTAASVSNNALLGGNIELFGEGGGGWKGGYRQLVTFSNCLRPRVGTVLSFPRSCLEGSDGLK